MKTSGSSRMEVGSCKLNHVVTLIVAAVPAAVSLLKQINWSPAPARQILTWQMLFPLCLLVKAIRSSVLSGNRTRIHLHCPTSGLYQLSSTTSWSRLQGPWSPFHSTEHHAGPLHSWYHVNWTQWAGSSNYVDTLVIYMCAKVLEINPTKILEPSKVKFVGVYGLEHLR